MMFGSSNFWVAFEHTQNESSDLSSFLGFGLALGEPSSLIVIWSSSDWLFFQSYGEFVDASCIPNLLCQCCPSHTCVMFCSKEVSLCRPSQCILSYISWPSLVSSWFAIVLVSIWWSFLHLVRGRRPQLDFWHLLYFFTSMGCFFYTTCYTDIGIGELVIHFTLRHGSTVYCSWPWPYLFHHGSALYVLAAMFTLSMGMPASGYLLGYDLLTFATGVPSVSAGLPSPLLHQRYLVMHFGHQHLLWSHALGGICYSWDSHQSYIWWYWRWSE